MVWVGAFRFKVQTGTDRWAKTDDRIEWTIYRSDDPVAQDVFSYPDEDDLENGAMRFYSYPTRESLVHHRSFDKTPPPTSNVQVSHPNFPPYGVEFSDGLSGSLSIVMGTSGHDAWLKDRLDLYVKYWKPVPNHWVLDDHWTYVGGWSQDRWLSTDPSEGKSTHRMILT